MIMMLMMTNEFRFCILPSSSLSLLSLSLSLFVFDREQNETTLRDGNYFWWVGLRSERGREKGKGEEGHARGSDVKLD